MFKRLAPLPLVIALTAGGLGLAAPAFANTTTPASAQALSVAPAPLLQAAELKALIGQPGVRVLDIRADKDYATGHIPGAVNTPYGKYRGPKENPGQLPSEAALSALLQAAGVDRDSHVVVVHAGTDHTDFGAAARVYWTLKVGGLTRLSILDGGTKAWKSAGGALETTTPQVAASQFAYRYDQEQIVSGEELAAALEAGKAPLLVDARPPKFFAGEARTDAAARYGTLPGAKSFDNAQFFPKDGTTLKPASELKALVALSGADKAPAVSFCNTGHWAATNWFVMSEIAGNKAVKLYPASVVEWSQSERPMENQPSRVTALVQDVKRAFDK
ncbi:Putative thiosulfate sulfurtransferase [Thauera sp. GDN1]|uniref:sulfurtransferase n=1 Tax=Thauera sp. GDN1 TaxID=2944810 RepID=UPI0024784A9F|nr:rhodanese-like domain-containing protein [Thauera sp. GDN1]WEN40875.1 Putative thiosulfate sulfurtransferase [Thauera sp. GDN1]